MEKGKWNYGVPAKTGAILILILSLALTVGALAGCCYLWEDEVYAYTKREKLEQSLEYYAREDAACLLNLFMNDLGESAMAAYTEEKNVSYLITDTNGETAAGSYEKAKARAAELADLTQTDSSTEALSFSYSGERLIELLRGLLSYEIAEETVQEQLDTYAEYEVSIYIDESFPQRDEYAVIYRRISAEYAFRYWIYPILAAAVLLSVCSFIFLMCSAGHRRGTAELVQGTLVRIPLDLYLAGAAGTAVPGTWIWGEILQWAGPNFWSILSGAVMWGITISLLTGFFMNLAVRIKCRTLLRNTICFRLLRWVVRLCRRIAHGIWYLLRGIPMVRKTVLLFLALAFAEFLVLAGLNGNFSEIFQWFLLEKAVLLLITVYFVQSLKLLQKGAKALAGGDLEYQVDTGRLILELKEHGENLNSIGKGMTAAVNERMKSERMKTELITNVSHDIKTPLTSIINYTDLIAKEHSDNEKINEYTSVLARQSARLKKLIEDLVEASKASTGNLEVNLAPMELGVMLVQAVGEYKERLEDRKLQLVVKQPEEAIQIMADGRRLWRVLDNLMNNVCKYAQEGTRVYLTVEKREREAVIILKNTSNYPLDIPAQELMERFVRGDDSRSTEGNGLGLSIAQSLTQLQNGSMELVVDGDLFKVLLTFPLLERV